MSRILILLFFLLTSKAFCQDLYPINENGKWGFIDQNGKVVIQPQYDKVGEFNDGLAPVRVTGLYGYINAEGEMIVSPKYHYAADFNFGHAVVSKDGKYAIIDKAGNPVLQVPYPNVAPELSQPNLIEVCGSDFKKKGIITLEGKALADTMFYSIDWNGPNDEYVVLSEYKGFPTPNKISIITVEGKTILAPGKYYRTEEIEGVGWLAFDTTQHVSILKTDGSLLYDGAGTGLISRYAKPTVSEGKMLVEMTDFDEFRLIDLKGRELLTISDCKEALPFKSNRTFIRRTDDKWYLIDSKGKVYNSSGYRSILYDGYKPETDFLFEDGTELVETKDGWMRIDLYGKQIDCPACASIKDADRRTKNLVRIKQHFHFDEWLDLTDMTISDETESYEIRQMNASEKKLVAFVSGDTIGYKNRTREIIWTTLISDLEPARYDVDHSFRWSFDASSPYREDTEEHGGWANTKNWFVPMDSIGFEPKEQNIGMYVNTDSMSVYNNKLLTHTVFLYNNSDEEILFSAMDSRLYMHIEVMKPDGTWMQVTDWVSSGCGNSYHKVYLPPGNCWTFQTPVFDGPIRTEVRLSVSTESDNQPMIYSNTFSACVNPGLFYNGFAHYHGALTRYFD